MSHSINKVAAWYHWLDSIGCRFISEVDCKYQLNNIKPSDITNHFTNAWLAKRKRWRMAETTWSIHRETKRLDWVGLGNLGKFWFIDHETLAATVDWEMNSNNCVVSAGKLWTRHVCIPMGRSFSAQAADLYSSLWSLYQARHLFHLLGTLQISEQGIGPHSR